MMFRKKSRKITAVPRRKIHLNAFGPRKFVPIPINNMISETIHWTARNLTFVVSVGKERLKTPISDSRKLAAA
jgi:hypothetical protein